ncbi:MAG: cellulose biosynthesis cyclic di-GMP-binding regulatory protein BcsB [Chloroflexota bacterium]
MIQRALLLTILLVVFLIPVHPVSAEGDLSIDIPLESLNGDQTISLTGLVSTQNLEFTLPDNWKITDQSLLDLSITASDLLDLSASSLTISLNGLQLTSLQLKDLVGSARKIELPSSYFIPGNNKISFDAILYLPDDLKTNCKGWDDPSRWLLFNPQSVLHIAFQEQSFPSDLSNFPQAFLQPLDRYLKDGGDKTLFVLPDQVKPDDLNALTATAYFLGHQAGDKYVWNPQILTQSQFGQLNTINSNIVFVDNIPAQFENVIATEKNAIGVFASPWDASKTVMVVFDKDREDGYTPTLIFGDWMKKILLHGNVAYFDRTADKNPPVFKNKYSFEELGYLDRTVRGIGVGSLVYKIYIPYDVDPTKASLALQIAHNPDLDQKTSSIEVNLNGFTVASILPATNNARLEPIRVDLPTKRFHPGTNFLRISFDLHIPYSSCEKAPQTVWATIFNSSTFQLTYQNRASIPVLNDFPAPFNEYPGVTFVVPTQLDMHTLTQVSQLTFAIGANSYYSSQPPKVLTSEKYSVTQPKDENYILVGLPSRNLAIRDLNNFLPQPFKPNTDQLQEGFGVFLPTINSEASIGLMQIVPSPWRDSREILVLSGTKSEGLEWAWNAILDPKTRKQFSGNLMVVGPERGTSAQTANTQSTTILFEQTPMVVKIPIIGKFLQQNGQSEETISLIAIALAGLFTLIALNVAPVISRFEIKLKSHPDKSEKEQE